MSISKHTSRNVFSVEDVRVNAFSAEYLVARLREALRTGRGLAVATLNLDHVVKLRRDPVFREAYAQHDLVTADGFPIVLAGRLQGRNVVRTPGSDLVSPLMQLAAEEGCSIALIGSRSESLAKADMRLRAEHSGLDIVLTVAPAFGFDPTGREARHIGNALRESGARLCFLALGAPKQEIFAAFLKQFAPSTCVVSVGAGLDFISGHQVRAPKLMQRLNLEWAWRLVSNPRRLAARYAQSAVVFPGLILSALGGRP